ncbi:GNAT family N-acetyltransferase [Sphingomonas donggukensis]|uniref:GNAT family N-acetyltransferase n=1 Tax=Sphingomonas donggukensis TaxID=2949093 RepID=A0ABY4TW99_9SPHN|nr:GNAT family N-acetyltransferase [Sphingomonas donggukensis]URW76673.1 GNAT family N-acetyltransferase [Sphingomonas donggukensis]
MIKTERLLLRRWRAADIDPFHAMGQDAEVMRFIGPAMSRADCAAAAERMNAVLDATGTCFWAIERRADGAFLGFCGIKPGPAGTPIADLPEIGWRLRRDAWGAGYAREAAQASIDRAWSEGNAGEIFAITVAANTRSWGLMERLGMARVADSDFDHPALAEDDPLRRHITYRIARPA